MPETPDLTERARVTLTAAIRAVTDAWEEPLDEVHDVPQVVNSVLAWAAQQSAAAERVSVSAEAVAEAWEAAAAVLDKFADNARDVGIIGIIGQRRIDDMRFYAKVIRAEAPEVTR